MKKEFSSGFVIYYQRQREIYFLLLYHGGRYWSFPKGHIEKNEDSLTAALREVEEETGLKRDKLMIKKFKGYDRFHFKTKYGRIFKLVTYRLARSKTMKITISKEHKGYGWFTFKEAQRMLIYQNQKNLLKSAYEVIQPKSHRRRQENTPRPGENLQRGGNGGRQSKSLPGRRPNPEPQPSAN